MNNRDNALRRKYADFDTRPAHIYAEAAAYVQQQKILALKSAMQSLFRKAPRQRN